MHWLIRVTYFALIGWWLGLAAIGIIALMGLIPPLWPLAIGFANKLDRVFFLW